MNYAILLSETLRQVPTLASARAALAILLQLAQTGDMPAARVLGAVLAEKLACPEAIPEIENLQSLHDVLTAERIPPLLRGYLLAFIPRELMSQADSLAQAYSDSSGNDEYAQFQRLVLRDDILQHEVLKAYCLKAYVGMMNTSITMGVRGRRGWLPVLESIINGCRVIPGVSANSKFEIGRDLILAKSVEGLSFILGHEMGHHLFGITIATRGDADIADDEVLSAHGFLSLQNVLPDVIRFALARKKGESSHPVILPGQQVSLIVTVSETQRGNYMHWSLTKLGEPIPLPTAMFWISLFLELFGISTTETVVALSPRGVCHFGFIRKIDPNIIVWPSDVNEAARRLATIQHNADIWLEELILEKKIGSDGMSIPEGLGLEEPTTDIFCSDSKAVEDMQDCENFQRHKNSFTVSNEQANQLMGVGMRCAYPALIKPLLDVGIRPEPYLRDLGASICVTAPPDPAEKKYFGPTAANILAVFGWLHAQGIDIDTVIDDQGTTLLLDAVRHEGAGVSILLGLGADPNHADVNGNTALHAVIGSKQGDLIDKLLQSGAAHDCRNSKGQTALALAVALDDAHAVERLLQMGADPDARDATGATPLMHALSGKIARQLINAGAEPDAVDHSLRTPLMAAAEGECAEVVCALLDAGADPEQSDDLGYTALHYAVCQFGHPAMVCLSALRDAGADIDEESRAGKTALMMAAQTGNVDAAKLLLSWGADVNACCTEGKTALIYAAAQGHVDIVSALHEAGADINAIDAAGNTPLHFVVSGARSSENAQWVAERLQEQGTHK